MELSREDLKNLLKEALKESQPQASASSERKYHTVWEGVVEGCPSCTEMARKALEKLGVGKEWESLKKEVEELKARLAERPKEEKGWL